MPPRKVVFGSMFCLVPSFFLFFVASLVNVCHSCPSFSNATEEQLLKSNPSLRKLYDQYVDNTGKLSLSGLRQLVTQLQVLTSCPLAELQEPSEVRASDEDYADHSENGHHHNLDQHESHNHNHDSHNLNHDEHGSDHNPDHNHDHDHDERMESLNKNGSKISNELGHVNSGDAKGPIDSREVAAFGTKDCDAFQSVISTTNLANEGDHGFGPHTLLHVCPSILISLLTPPCGSSLNKDGSSRIRDGVSGSPGKSYDHHNHNHHHRKLEADSRMTKEAWIGAVLSMVLIGLIALACIMLIPVLKKSRYYIMVNHFLLALAVGSLAGDALIHLLPHAMTMEIRTGMNAHLIHALYGFTAFLGILMFLLMERIHNMVGHKHSHGHSHDVNDGDEFVKEIGVLSAELNETPHNADKIGEKLSQHSKHSSFVYADSTSPAEVRGCFESCPPNLVPGCEDANGNNGVNAVICKPRVADHSLASDAECERLVTVHFDKLEEVPSTKVIAPIPPPPLVQSSPPKSIVRQDSKNFNMVLQEYHVGHHGHSHHGHSHVTGKKDSLRTMILLGDGMHTFMDGMAIGAAFGTSLTGGIATAVAVLCHELPHKVGDFAILFEMGMRRNQALKMVVILWLLSLAGLAVGVSIGSIHEVSPWIYCFTAGVFLYLALVDLLSELSINGNETCSAASQMMLQVAGMMTGALIMLVIAIYEHDLEEILKGLL